MPSTQSRAVSRGRRTSAALALTAVVVTTTAVTSAAASASSVAPVADATPGAAVVTQWNAIAQRTVFTENAVPVPASPVWFAGVSLAVYDAVVTVEGRYEPYAGLARPAAMAGRASSEVAAATAAYRVLAHDFPASAANLRADYDAFLATQPRSEATGYGKRVGASAARAVIDLRTGDGRGAPVTLTTTPAPGVWRPTPPAEASMVTPWLGFVRPFLVDSPAQFAPPGPAALDSAEYAADVAEVQAYGAATGSARTPEQTATALFFNANVAAQYQAAMRASVTERGLDIVESARAFALLNAATADAIITTWRTKYDQPTWRPITAIRLADTDGNDATTPDTGWAPLVNTPAYPEYPSGHATLTGALTGTLAELYGADDVDVTVPSLGAAPARTYATGADLDADAKDGRVWLGIHFRTAMDDANDLGHAVAAYASDRFFQPVSD